MLGDRGWVEAEGRGKRTNLVRNKAIRRFHTLVDLDGEDPVACHRDERSTTRRTTRFLQRASGQLHEHTV